MDRKRQHCRAVTSFPLMVKGKAWLGIKDPPAGEGQVGQKHLFDKGETGRIEKNTKGFSFIYRALDIMIIDISKNPQDLQLQLLEKELFSTHHNDDHS